MKRYLCYFTTMFLVFVITDFCLGGTMLRFGNQVPDKVSDRLSSMNNIGSQLRRQKDTEEVNEKELGKHIASVSCEFVRAIFNRDRAKITGMLYEDTEYVVSEDKSSYIRYITDDLHIEGYMATDRKLVQARQVWYVIQDDGTITSGVEVEIEGEEIPQTWYIHYRKSLGNWKIFMLENGI